MIQSLLLTVVLVDNTYQLLKLFIVYRKKDQNLGIKNVSYYYALKKEYVNFTIVQ